MVDTFGLCWLGDSTTITQISLLHMLILCGTELLVIVSICDFTGHMVDGWKKDTEFIMNFFKENVEEVDSAIQHTDCFFMVPQACKKLEQFFVHTSLVLSAFMVESISFPYF